MDEPIKQEELPFKEKLEMLEAALDHFYDTNTETLLSEYQCYLDKKQEAARAALKGPPDRDEAIAYFASIPDKCNNNASLEMKPEMLEALSEEDFIALCAEQTKSHPKIEAEIRSMFDFCLKMKRMM